MSTFSSADRRVPPVRRRLTRGAAPWLLLAPALIALAVLLFIAGLFCAPTITATLDHLSRVVPARVRGEAMGWHGSALTAGSAVGAPVIGFAMDAGGWPAGFWVAGAAGLLIGLVGQGLVLLRRRRQSPA